MNAADIERVLRRKALFPMAPSGEQEIEQAISVAYGLERDNKLLGNALQAIVDSASAPMWMRPDVYGAFVRATWNLHDEEAA